ncbi:hypothetical protein MYX65_03240 [Acidobacteria bacterium AH-259-L09]|nr:hypothetical protein [Acidobacteria bacterium AH-259-L09]
MILRNSPTILLHDPTIWKEGIVGIEPHRRAVIDDPDDPDDLSGIEFMSCGFCIKTLILGGSVK